MRFHEDVRPTILSDVADSHTRFIHVQSAAQLDRLLVSVGAAPVHAASDALVVPFLGGKSGPCSASELGDKLADRP